MCDKNSLNLTKIRKIYAQELERNLVKYLEPLGLEGIKFMVDFASVPISENGVDSVEFMFSANEGQPLSPLSNIASGGEMSRFLLALKTPTLLLCESFLFSYIVNNVEDKNMFKAILLGLLMSNAMAQEPEADATIIVEARRNMVVYVEDPIIDNSSNKLTANFCLNIY